jgi:hypothetical protein
MYNDSLVNNSGNSKVDISINIDTTGLAVFLGTYLHATRQLSDDQFFLILNNLYLLSGKDNELLKNLISNESLINSKTILTENTFETLKKFY